MNHYWRRTKVGCQIKKLGTVLTLRDFIIQEAEYQTVAAHLAKQRLENTENKLKKTPEVMRMYTETIDKYLENGYITKLDHKTEPGEGCHYIPHFPVMKMERDTTKTRIVFDESAKDKYYENLSLNETIHQGPKLYSSLFDILLHFRHKPIALAGDISEMYMQILMDEGDRPFHRFPQRCNNKQINSIQIKSSSTHCNKYTSTRIDGSHAGSEVGTDYSKGT